MNLDNINKHLNRRKYKNEIAFFEVLYNFCHRYKIDYATFSTVGRDYMGNSLTSFDKEGYSNTTLFDTKKIKKEQSYEKLNKLLKSKYVNGKRDIVVIYRSFWGLQKLVIYDSKTNTNLAIKGNEQETAMDFKKLVDLYHSL